MKMNVAALCCFIYYYLFFAVGLLGNVNLTVALFLILLASFCWKAPIPLFEQGDRNC